MRAKIHRGANEVGGSCIELESSGQRLVLDLGRPIWAQHDEHVPRPPVSGLEHDDPSMVGVVISHPHLDHYGLSPGIAASAPVFMGEAAHRLLSEASFFTGDAVPPAPKAFLRHRERFVVGPFTITPYLNDHSAFDAYSLLVEADGCRLFYTGDIRGHGRKRGIFEQLLRSPPAKIDVLLMEGTNIREGGDIDARGPTESDVEDSIAELAQTTSGIVLAAFSPQNIDRLVTTYRAAIKSGRDLVLDLYGATMTAATELATIPQATWDRVRVYLPRSQRSRVIKHGEFARTDAVRAARIYPDELRTRAGELIVLFRGSMARELAAAECLAGAHLVWSMWPGYLRDESGVALQARLAEHGIPMSIHHSSGHAFVPDLRRLVDALAPARVVPIHSFAGDRFTEMFPCVDRRLDGEWWDV
jgi:ribonuclease J